MLVFSGYPIALRVALNIFEFIPSVNFVRYGFPLSVEVVSLIQDKCAKYI